MTGRTRKRTSWRAGIDGIGHAYRTGFPRTLCYQPPVEERWAHPERERCARCLETVAMLDRAR